VKREEREGRVSCLDSASVFYMESGQDGMIGVRDWIILVWNKVLRLQCISNVSILFR
jgi:hypothetical protein